MGDPPASSARGIRVLLLTPWFPNVPGDREGNFVHDSASALSRAGAAVRVLVVRPWLRDRLGQARYRSLSPRFDGSAFPAFEEVTLTHYLGVPGNRLPRIAAWLHDMTVGHVLGGAATRSRPTIIHAHSEGEAPVATAIGRKMGLPVVVTLHGINTAPQYFGSRHRRNYIVAGLRAADRVLLVGKPLVPFFSDLVGMDRNFAVLPNGFDPPLSESRDQIGGTGQLRFIAVSNLHQGKGIDIALQALAIMRRNGNADFTFTIVGDGAERSSLEHLTDTLGLRDKVYYIGACPHAEVYRHLRQADIFLLPSYREAFGVAYLEAMAAGLLAIGVLGEGPSAFIRDEETGLLVPPRDATSLAERLIRLTADIGRLRALAAAGQAHAMQNLTWDHHAQGLVQVYRDVIGAREQRERPESMFADKADS